MSFEWTERIEALERDNRSLARSLRRTRTGAVLVGLIGGLALLTAAGERVQVVEVQEVRVVDKKGNLRVSLSANPAGPGLAVFGEDGKEIKGSLPLKDGAPLLTLKDGGARVSLSARADDGSSVILQESGGGQTIATARSGAGVLAVKDAEGTTRFKAP